MDEFAKTSRENRRSAFQETAAKKGINILIAEKDFWVCWTLKRLFSLGKFTEHLVFKGGTSLSKVYQVIDRFSEDIDVAIERALLSEIGDNEFAELSAKKRDRIVKEVDNKCKDLIQTEILSELRISIDSQLGNTVWSLEIDGSDPFGQTILFEYPRSDESEDGAGLRYVRPIVKIELGARPTNEPSESHSITPYAAESLPTLFSDSSVTLRVLAAERTFWEKATILHDLFHREPSYIVRDRFSRHYYDLFQMSRHGWAEKALERTEILASVVANKKAFFHRAGAKYDDSANGQIRLFPNENLIKSLRADYKRMSEMIFGEPPDFDGILDELRRLEAMINERFGRHEESQTN